MKKTTLGVIVTNRAFFPDKFVIDGRQEILKILARWDIDVVILEETATKLGAVESWTDAKACADLFRRHRDKIDGILVTLPNFGDEKGVADAIRLSGLNVPVLVHAFPDDISDLSTSNRRDAFCGKISVCNDLYQYDIPYSLTQSHTVDPQSDEFKAELGKFVGLCQVVKGMRSARLGAVGARPDAFKTVRYSEKLLEASGISVSTLDLSEVFGSAQKLADGDSRVRSKLEEIHSYADAKNAPPASVVLMAKLGIVLSDWMNENDIDATAIQCWSSLQNNYGVNVCTIMSMMSEKLMPSACEVDIAGVASMYALQLASGKPSALVDWNNSYANEPDKCIYYHCGNWAKSFVPEIQMVAAEVLGSTLGLENTWGAVDGRTDAGPLTFARIDTDDRKGRINTYVGEGRFTDDYLSAMSGTRAVVEVPGLQKLMRYVCKNGFAHHAAMSQSSVASILAEAFETYLGWDVYHHEG
ncbi:MAG: L-fucose/L-arabinose isomerase family protein [Caldilineaceae bacterium]|nr:L-fucose/L-arabinose isomerase family protein [Caldilineaceae bacterium]